MSVSSPLLAYHIFNDVFDFKIEVLESLIVLNVIDRSLLSEHEGRVVIVLEHVEVSSSVLIEEVVMHICVVPGLDRVEDVHLSVLVEGVELLIKIHDMNMICVMVLVRMVLLKSFVEFICRIEFGSRVFEDEDIFAGRDGRVLLVGKVNGPNIELRVTEGSFPICLEVVRSVVCRGVAGAGGWVSVLNLGWGLVVLVAFERAEDLELLPPIMPGLFDLGY